MAGSALDRRDRAGAGIGVGVMIAMALVMVIGVPEEVGDRIVLPVVLAGLAIAVALSRRRLRLLATAVAAGVVAGLALGLALRLAMFVAAVMGGGVERTVGGTAFVVVFTVLPATVFSAAVALLRRLVAVRPSAAAALTTVLGGLMLLGDREELAGRGLLVVNVVTFLASFALYGWLVVTLQQRVEEWWDRRALVDSRSNSDGGSSSSHQSPERVP